MTVIAWDGRMLAADKAASSAGYKRTVTKVFRLPDGMVAFSGDGDYALALLEWFRTGRDAAKYPESQKSDTFVDALFVDLQGVLWTYGKTPYPQRSEDKFNASGHGRDYALAAMYLGHDAKRAVEVACALDSTCGNGVDVLELVPLAPVDVPCGKCGQGLTLPELFRNLPQNRPIHLCDRCEGVTMQRPGGA